MFPNKRMVTIVIIIISITLIYIKFGHSKNNRSNQPTSCPSFARKHDLRGIPWPYFERPNSLQDVKALDIQTTIGQQRTLGLLLEQFERVVISLRLHDQWFLNAGTLLGSLQHHDFIPWDDDADLMLHIRHRPIIQAALRSLSPIYDTYDQGVRDKLYFHPFHANSTIESTAIGSRRLPKYPWAWPFIDIAYYEEIGPNLGQEYKVRFHKFNLSDIFPLSCRPFGKHWYPTPGRPISFLKSYYRTSQQVCSSHDWSHIEEKAVKRVVVDCRALMEKYPFVHRCSVPNSSAEVHPSELCDEYLVDGKGKVMHTIRTVLDKDECESLLFTVRHESFKCP